MGTVPPAYPTFPGLRIAYRVRISNEKAHAYMYYVYCMLSGVELTHEA